MKRNNWEVKEFGIRPAGKPDRCFYCNSKLGEQHKQECVIRSQTVVIKLSMKLVVNVPEDWDEEAINFKYQQSSFCNDSLLRQVMDMKTRTNECMCHLMDVEFVREANEKDEQEQKFFVKDLPQ